MITCNILICISNYLIRLPAVAAKMLLEYKAVNQYDKLKAKNL